MPVKYNDDAVTTLASSLSAVALTCSVSSSSTFPTLSTGEYFFATIIRASDNAKETIKVTAVSGTTWTIIRARGAGESALAFLAADAIEIRMGVNLIQDTTIGYTYADKYTSFSDAVDAAAASTIKELFISTAVVMAASKTVPGTVTLRFIRGGSIETTGYTLTADCYVVASKHQTIFIGTGTVIGKMKTDYVGTPVCWFGAIADNQVTDCIAAFNRARTSARASWVPVYVPSSYYPYKLSSEYVMDEHSDRLVGDGNMHSILFQSGTLSVVRVASRTCSVSNLMLCGSATSLHGLHLSNANTAADIFRNTFDNILISGVSGDGVRITNGQSNRFNAVIVDRNSFTFPPGINVTVGDAQHNFHILSNIGGTGTNNNTFSNCQSNGGGAVYGVKIGTAGGNLVETTAWYGGLMQGTGSNKELYLHGSHTIFKGVHIEPATPPNPAVAGVIIDGGLNSYVESCLIAANVEITASTMSGFRDCILGSVTIDTTSDACVVTGCLVGSTFVGGKIVDKSNTAICLNNAMNSENTVYGINGGPHTEIFSSNAEDWTAYPTLNPCGFSNNLLTVTRESVIVRTGTYSIKCVATADTNYLKCLVPIASQLRGKWVCIETWVYNVTTTSLCTVTANIDGGGVKSTSGATHRNGAWERVQMSYKIGAAGNFLNFRWTFSGAGTIYVDGVKITTDGQFSPPKEITLDTSATPLLAPDGDCLQAPIFITPAGSNITEFQYAHIGVPITLKITGNRTLVHDAAKIVLNGAINFAGVAGNTITLMPCSNDTFIELSRKI